VLSEKEIDSMLDSSQKRYTITYSEEVKDRQEPGKKY
jgi:hypothetical protein